MIHDTAEIVLRNKDNEQHSIWFNVFNTSLSRKWYDALHHILKKEDHLEKNYLWHGWADGERDGAYICSQINRAFDVINNSDLDYHINDYFDIDDILIDNKDWDDYPFDHDRLNKLHLYFEDLQGTTQNLSHHYIKADHTTKWHIRQLNNLCHEFESWALSYRKKKYSPEWQRPSLLFCFLQSAKFELTENDMTSFGIDALCKDFGGVYLGVNKAVGKHHFEVFKDEHGAGIDELTTTTMRGQTLASGDFDIDLAKTDRHEPWRVEENKKFRQWLIDNGFDPEDKTLTIGHPKVGQINMQRSFDAINDEQKVWDCFYRYPDIYQIKTSKASCTFDYHWSDADYEQKQIEILRPGYIYTEQNK